MFLMCIKSKLDPHGLLCFRYWFLCVGVGETKIGLILAGMNGGLKVINAYVEHCNHLGELPRVLYILNQFLFL